MLFTTQGRWRKTVKVRVKRSMHQRETIAQNVEWMKRMKKTTTKSIRIKIASIFIQIDLMKTFPSIKQRRNAHCIRKICVRYLKICFLPLGNEWNETKVFFTRVVWRMKLAPNKNSIICLIWIPEKERERYKLYGSIIKVTIMPNIEHGSCMWQRKSTDTMYDGYVKQIFKLKAENTSVHETDMVLNGIEIRGNWEQWDFCNWIPLVLRPK